MSGLSGYHSIRASSIGWFTYLALGASGLAQNGNTATLTLSREFNAPFAQVWKAANTKAVELGPIANQLRRGGELWVLIDYGDVSMADTAMRQVADLPEPLPDFSRDGGCSLRVRVQQKGKKTSVEVKAFFVLRAHPFAAAYLSLGSKGTLEAQLLDAIASEVMIHSK
jgi:hypothetical protein